MKVVITDAASEALIGNSVMPRVLRGEAHGSIGPVNVELGDEYVLIANGYEDHEYFYAVIESSALDKIPTSTWNDALARIHRVLRSVSRGPVRLPTSWSEYHHENLIAFFAVPENRNAASLRWIAEIRSDDHSVIFGHVTDSRSKTQLSDYNSVSYRWYRNQLDEMISRTREEKKDKASNETTGIVEKVDFEAVGSSAISQSLPYESWLSKLTDGQKRVLSVDACENVRIMGSAGSGKTVALCMRAVQEANNDREQRLRILFATHSWAMAERIDGALSSINSGAVPSQVEVWPLLQVLRDVLKGDFVGRIGVLGDDSTEGRTFQLDIIEELVLETPSGDIQALSNQDLNVEIASGLNEGCARPIAENLYQEFNGVLLPNGVRPGDSQSVENYLSSGRGDDMPPFKSRGDLFFVLNVYRRFLSKLQEWGFVTNDQLVSDAIRVLETFSWDVRRQSAGFDIIFVDELQLFDAQERMALTLLSRNSDRPVFVTAEDPSQGVFSTVSPTWRNGTPLSGDDAIELATGHRFNSGILNFIKHLYLAFPLNASALTIEPGQDASEGDVPKLYQLDSVSSVNEALEHEVKAFHSRNGRLAVISLGYDAKEIAQSLSASLPNVVLVDSLDDIERLTYQKRSVVVGSWSYLGGTQFDRVIVVGKHLGRNTTAFNRMKELIALYVASSRATTELALILAEGVPEVASRAVDLGVLSMGSG